MSERDPRVVFSSGDPAEVNVLAVWLGGQGIDAQVMNEQTSSSIEGVLSFSPDLGFREAEIWVQDPADADRARELIEHRRAELATRTTHTGEIILVKCEECGQEAKFDGSLAGSVQTCPHCEAFVDVPGGEEWDIGEEEE
jgi:hypothetical protein